MAKNKKAPAEKRTIPLTVLVSPKEKKEFEKLADDRRQTVSELVRQELFRALDFERVKQIQSA